MPTPTEPNAARRAELPGGTRIAIDPGTSRPRPGILVGGSPWRILRLTPAGDRLVDRWAVGEPVPPAPPALRLAGRLLDSGMAWPRPEPDLHPPIGVVVPTRDRPDGLALTLDALGSNVDVVVVDDASGDPGAVSFVVSSRPRTRIIRRAQKGGPAAARNQGWLATSAAIVAFVDADCRPDAGWLEALAGHFRDPAVGAVAPRVLARTTDEAPGWLNAYERGHSPLDLGPSPGPVRPRSRIGYVPTAALLVRRHALVELGGFDEALSAGEDVDLIWRLDAAGWRVRYDPSVSVSHPVRPTAVSWARQRFTYGSSAGPLAARHGASVAPLVVSGWSAATWILAAFGHPLAGVAVAAASLPPLTKRARRSGLTRSQLAAVALKGHLHAGMAIADAVRRTWWPLALGAAVVSPRARRAALVVAIVPPLVERRARRPDVRPLPWIAARLADDIAYGAGVWAGAFRVRSLACLRPARPRPT